MVVNMVSISDAVKALCPNAGFACGNTYASLSWQDTNVSKPTEDEVNAKRDELELLYPMKELRRQRDIKLKESDVYGLSDYPFTNDTIKQAWLTYRQALRDLPATASPQLDANGYLTNVTWPTPPS